MSGPTCHPCRQALSPTSCFSLIRPLNPFPFLSSPTCPPLLPSFLFSSLSLPPLSSPLSHLLSPRRADRDPQMFRMCGRDISSALRSLLVFVRACARRGRDRAATHDLGFECADVPHQYPMPAAGPFRRGPLVRLDSPLKPSDAIRAIQITSAFPSVTGPVLSAGGGGCRPRSFIADLRNPITAMPCLSKATSCPVFLGLRRPLLTLPRPVQA